MEARAAIEVKAVTKMFGKVEALRSVSFDVAKNEFVSLLGESGCGKTTMLRIIAGLISPTSGEVVAGSALVKGPQQNIRVVFQDPTLLPWRSNIKNVLLPIEIAKLDTEKYHEKAEELLKFVGLGGFENMYPYELSGGMQQRVNLCRALISDPDILLMDEPFGPLDAITRDKMDIELLRIIRETKKTILFVTHDITEAVLLSDRVVVMTPRPGKIAKIVEIDIAKPRDVSVRGTKKFYDYSSEIRRVIGLKG
jgi:NitT/TauT family transport system ATP-binding protein